ncbi:MAG: PQQ-dependent sugar dehydrogenase [Chloroflexi bacterium]|nr:PQQ-dependent sugar dehydrogenase [Chloroflexota bacterium]
MIPIRMTCLIVLLLSLSWAQAQENDTQVVITREDAPSARNIRLTTVVTEFDRPLYVTHAGDGSGRLFVVEQGGKIWIVRAGVKSALPFLDVSQLISPIALTGEYTERGLLGLAFHPDYKNNGQLFINYTDRKGDTVVSRYRVSAENPDTVDALNADLILYLRQPHEFHNGGHLAFGSDGYLYMALGDGGPEKDPAGAGQNRQILHGSILRVDVDSGSPYVIPADNPFVNDAGARDEIWAYGLRNPWRFSFDRATDDMYIGDVGDRKWEEVNFEPADSSGGRNYGWNVYEGNAEFAGGEAPNYSPPFFVYGHEHGCSVTGGYVYRGEAIPDLQGVYLFGDFCSGRIWASWRDPGYHRRVIELMDTDLTISSFGEDEAGETYLVDFNRGRLYRIDPYFVTAVTTRDQAPQVENFSLTRVAAGFHRPLYVTHAGDASGRLFLVEQSGKIWILRDGVKSGQPFLDISHLISQVALTSQYTEQGLLGLAFHPEYATNGRFFVNYTDRDGSTLVSRYQVSLDNADFADAASARVIFQLPQPYNNHNGGHIDFGHDGYLYIALGDGGSANDPLGAGQNRQLLLGSILRIDVDSASPYAIPPDNPFVSDASGLDEIWSYGWRNPWRFSFDRATGDMYIADVGQNQWEEVNFEPASSIGGENYGWNVFEGNTQFSGGSAPDAVDPFFVYGHSHGCSVTGGYIYRGEAIPDLQAAYLFGDFCSGRIWATWRDSAYIWRAAELFQAGFEISSFGEDEAGEMYVIDYGGALYRFDPVDN